MRTRNEMMPPADAVPVERPVRPGDRSAKMDDKTLLLKAARAAGYGLNARGQSLRETEMPNEPALWLTHATWWNPLTDSGQALDLAVTLEMDIGQMLTEGCVTVTGVAFDGEALAHDVPWGTDPTAATRRRTMIFLPSGKMK